MKGTSQEAARDRVGRNDRLSLAVDDCGSGAGEGNRERQPKAEWAGMTD